VVRLGPCNSNQIADLYQLFRLPIIGFPVLYAHWLVVDGGAGYLALRLYWGLYKGEKVKVHFTKSGYPFRFRPSVWFLFSS
jgi:hypothetical protein